MNFKMRSDKLQQQSKMQTERSAEAQQSTEEQVYSTYSVLMEGS